MRHTLTVPASLVVSSLLIVPVASWAQKRSDSSGGSTAASRREAILVREADLQNRSLRLRLLTEPGKNRTLSEDDRKLIVSQIFEDFERIQVVNREMTQASSSLKGPTYKRIATLAEEMGKRAKRLKTNLGIPDLAEEKKDAEHPLAIDVPQLKASLQALNVSVKSFVTSPLFKDPRVTDVGQLTNLRRDISNVIDLSRTVKKIAGKLH